MSNYYIAEVSENVVLGVRTRETLKEALDLAIHAVGDNGYEGTEDELRDIFVRRGTWCSSDGFSISFGPISKD